MTSLKFRMLFVTVLFLFCQLEPCTTDGMDNGNGNGEDNGNTPCHQSEMENSVAYFQRIQKRQVG